MILRKEPPNRGTPKLSGPGSNRNEAVYHTHSISRTAASPSDVVYCHAILGGPTSLRGIQSAYSKHPSQQGEKNRVLSELLRRLAKKIK